MKKLFILSLLVSLAFSSCSKENEIVVSGNDKTETAVIPEKENETTIHGNSGNSNSNNNNNNNNTSKKTVTIEVTSDNFATVEIPSVFTTTFDGTFRHTFTPNSKTILVKVTSEILSTKSIAIYVGDERVAYRRGNCPGNDYEISYELESL